jgi:hypothetical protein
MLHVGGLNGQPNPTFPPAIVDELREIGWGGMDWIHLAQNRNQWRALVNTVMSLQVP